MTDLRYPIGKFTFQVTYPVELRRQYLAEIAAATKAGTGGRAAP